MACASPYGMCKPLVPKPGGMLEEGVLAAQLLHKAAQGSSSLGKGAREEKKELSHLEAKAPSVASSKKSRKCASFAQPAWKSMLGKAKQMYTPASQACLSVWPCL